MACPCVPTPILASIRRARLAPDELLEEPALSVVPVAYNQK